MEIELTRPEALYIRGVLHYMLTEADANPGSIGHMGYRAYVAEMLEQLNAGASSLELDRMQALALAGILSAPDTPAPDDRLPMDDLREALFVRLSQAMAEAGFIDPPREE